MDLVTVKDVPLVKTGTWSASTGATPITTEDLEAMAEAHASGVLDKGVIKKGHLDPRMLNPTWDGDPAYGQVDNLRVSEDGSTLLGDYVNVPKDLAESLPSAYPNRSVEIAWGVKLRDAAGQVTKQFKAALSGVALLGRSAPAVKGLGAHVATLSAAFGVVETDSVDVLTSNFALPGGLTSNQLSDALRNALRAATKDDDELFPYVEDWDDTRLWFDANGKVFQISYAVVDGNVILGEEITPVTVKRVFEPAGDTLTIPQASALSGDSGDVAALTTHSAGNTKGTVMDFLQKAREKAGLPETATEDEILAAINAPALPGNTDQAPDGTTGATGETPPAGVEVQAQTAAAEAGKHAAPSATDGAPESVLVSKATLDALVASHSSLSAKVSTIEQTEASKRREDLLNGFVTSGKVHPTERSHFAALLEKAEPETVAMLSARVGIPVQEIGTPDASQVAQFADNDQYAAFADTFGLATLTPGKG